ncbi:MAG: SUMF1/EgtB/PvdO family nonheme iron enzyme, partial [Chthoniobacteraceae bacterium]
PAPATPAPKPLTEVEKWLAQVDGPQQEAFRQQISEPFETRMAELRKQHLAGLDLGFTRATSSKQLTEAIAWQKERKNFEDSRNVTGLDAGLPAGVQSLRANYRRQAGELEQWRALKAKTLHAAYDAILAQNQDALTQRQRLEDALLLQEKRDEIKRLWLAPMGAASAAERGKSGSIPPAAGAAMSFVNSLGMKFVPVPITGRPNDDRTVLFSIWETRVKDYEEFAKGDTLARTPRRTWPAAGFKQTALHPAVQVSWEDAVAFCEWLTKREQKSRLIASNARYRLPSDYEWSCAAGIAEDEEARATPEERHARRKASVYPWKGGWPPPPGVANLGDRTCEAAGAKKDGVIKDYDDGFPWTAPVGSFPPNALGIYDLSGNVREWCDDSWDGRDSTRVMRGGSWFHADAIGLLAGYREPGGPRAASGLGGFRIVLALGEATPAAATPPAAPVPIRTDAAQNSFTLAEIKRPFVNTLGMKFVPVPVAGRTTGQKVLFSIWETRVQDYEAFATETKRAWTKVTFAQEPAHPAVNVSWEDAQAFCNWLTERERRAGLIRATERYRLSTDLEWSAAIGSKTREDPKRTTPTDRSGKVQEFPWGLEWPPPRGAGNFSGEECKGIEAPGQNILPGYRDNFPTTAPVGSFKANRFGLYDLGGNVRELCEDLDEANPGQRIMRDAGFLSYEKGPMWWSARASQGEKSFGPSVGFRVVLASER